MHRSFMFLFCELEKKKVPAKFNFPKNILSSKMYLYAFKTLLGSKTSGYNCLMYPLVGVRVSISNENFWLFCHFWSNISEGHLRVPSPHILLFMHIITFLV